MQIEHAVFAGFCAVWLAFVVVNFTNERQYHVGECLTYDLEKEKWQKQYIFKVQEVGERHYRTRLWLGDRWGQIDDTDSFDIPYKHVPCPEEPS